MAGLAGPHPIADCPLTGKPCWTHAAARAHAKRERRRTGERVQEYRCRACEWWHWGIGAPRKRRRR